MTNLSDREVDNLRSLYVNTAPDDIYAMTALIGLLDPRAWVAVARAAHGDTDTHNAIGNLDTLTAAERWEAYGTDDSSSDYANGDYVDALPDIGEWPEGIWLHPTL